MGFLDYGTTKGLSYKHDYQRDIDRLYNREAFAMQVQKEKEEKAKYYGEMLQQTEAITSYNTSRLEPFYDELSQKLSDLAINNPNWETDINLQREFQGIARQFQDNDIIREDMQVAQELQSLKDKVHSREISKFEYERQYDKYRAYADQDPDSKEKVDQFIFTDYKKQTILELGSLMASKVAPTISPFYNELTGTVEQITKYDDKDIQNIINMTLSDEEDALTLKESYATVKGNGLYKSENHYYKSMVKSLLGISSIFKAFDPNVKAANDAERRRNEMYIELHPIFGDLIAGPLYESGETGNSNDNMVFSPFKAKGSGMRGNNVNGGVKISIKDEDGNIISYIDFPIDTYMIARNTLNMYMADFYIPRIETSIAVMLDSFEDSATIKILKENGFGESKQELPGIMRDLDKRMKGEKRTSVMLTGVIDTEALINETSVYDFEKIKSGSGDKASKKQAYGINKASFNKYERQQIESRTERAIELGWEEVLTRLGNNEFIGYKNKKGEIYIPDLNELRQE